MTERERTDVLSPAQLQDEMLVCYGRLPQFEGEPKTTTRETAEERLRRFFSEQNDPLQKKFDELVYHSPTTETFKEVISEMYHTIALIGRESPMQEAQALKRTLQLEKENGIFDKEGAKEAEKNLFNFVLDYFAEEFKEGLRVGEDMYDRNWEKILLMKYSLLETNKLLVKWFAQASELYLEPPWLD